MHFQEGAYIMTRIPEALDAMHEVDAYNLIEIIANGELAAAAEFM